MIEGKSVGNVQTVPLVTNNKNPKQTVTEKTNNALIKNDNSKFNTQLKGVPASSIEFNSDKPKEVTHIVKPGESLSSISRKYFGDLSHFKEIFNLNKTNEFPSINTPLEVSQVLKIPSVNKTGKQSEPDNKKLPEVKEKIKINIDLYTEPVKDDTLEIIKVIDAVKINKKSDIDPKLINTNIKSEFGVWAIKTAGILEENKASIVIASKDGHKYNIDPKFLKGLSDTLANNPKEGYKEIRRFFKEDLGIAFSNTVWTIDDLANNINTDPYYSEIKDQKKVFDLASVAKNYHIDNDKVDYMAKLGDHDHRGIPVIIESSSSLSSIEKLPTATPKEIINKLSESFDVKGNLKNGDEFEKQVYELLNDKDTRKSLTEHFKLTSNENTDALTSAITGESGASKSQQDYNSYLCVGSVILNRTLGRNLKKYAKATAQKIPEKKIKPVPVKTILMENGQFAITWAKVGTTGKTIFEYQNSLNTNFKQEKLKESGNSFSSFKLANEVVADLYDGIHHLKADVNGENTKNAGRNTSDLFYFNQSHNDDYSKNPSSGAAVKLIDVNNTQVFFKTWDGSAYFRYD